ncbi:MAG: hypothetical protein ACRCUE_00175 [Bosea sp. (in: a-proteobacteria)]
MKPLDRKALESAWRETLRKDGPSLFRTIRAARAHGKQPDPEVTRLHYAMIAGGPLPKQMTMQSEMVHFVKALLTASIRERGELEALAKAFLAGRAVDPEGLSGREREVAFAFYGELEDPFENQEFPLTPYAVAQVHEQHRHAAKAILARVKGSRGETRELKRRVFEIIDDFLIIVMIAARVAGLTMTFTGEPDETKSDFACFCERTFQEAERAYRCVATGRVSEDERNIVKLQLSDFHGRKLADRMHNIIKEFGDIDLEPVI